MLDQFCSAAVCGFVAWPAQIRFVTIRLAMHCTAQIRNRAFLLCDLSVLKVLFYFYFKSLSVHMADKLVNYERVFIPPKIND